MAKIDTKTEKSDKEHKKADLSDQQVLFEKLKNSASIDDIIPDLKSHLNKMISESEIAKDYQVIFLYDPVSSISDYTSDRIYRSLNQDKSKDVLLIIFTSGGQIEPAYLISKCCKEYSKNKFVVVIPRKAKSAGTLIALGGDEIHMGSMSQLGPIDPQIGGLPVLGLSNAVEYLAMFCKRWPESSDMFAKYLSNKLDLRIFGYFERVAESAAHYAMRLIGNKQLPDKRTSQDVGSALVYSYKDHNFVIDKVEASSLLGECIKSGTKEYEFGDKIYRFLEMFQIFVRFLKNKEFSLVGNIENGILFSNPTNNQ